MFFFLSRCYRPFFSAVFWVKPSWVYLWRVFSQQVWGKVLYRQELGTGNRTITSQRVCGIRRIFDPHRPLCGELDVRLNQWHSGKTIMSSSVVSPLCQLVFLIISSVTFSSRSDCVEPRLNWKYWLPVQIKHLLQIKVLWPNFIHSTM